MPSLIRALFSVFPISNGLNRTVTNPTPIDKALQACIDNNGSTGGMVECTDKAYARMGQRAD
jgi:hypothetical protein